MIVSLSDDQRGLIAVLQARRQAMTVRELQVALGWARNGVQQALEGLVERQVVARLNTVVPSYAYRYGGVDLDAG